VAALAAGACQDEVSDGVDEQDRLQALLRDAPLTQVPPAVSSAARADANTEAAPPIHSNLILPGADPLGAWSFDDCTSRRTNLSDQSFNENTAFRSVGVTCTAGIDNSQAVSLAVKEDIVYVPDQPSFTFEHGVTVAGWFKPSATGGTRTLFRKRDKDTSSFALVLDAGRFELVVSLGNGQAISVASPKRAQAGVFQHVAGTYDGTTARLYVDGVEVNSFAVPGTIPLGPGPLVMGNDGSERRFAGAIDSTLFATHALTAAQVQALLCTRFASPTVTVTPANGASTPAGVPLVFDYAITNTNTAACGAQQYDIVVHSESSGVTFDPPAFVTVRTDPVPAGTTTHFRVAATPDESFEPGTFLSFHTHVDEPISQFFGFFSSFFFVAEPDPSVCSVNTSRELMIKRTSVVDDPVRTRFTSGSSDPRNGVWTFKHLVENMAPTPADAPAMVEAMLNSMATQQVINGFTVAGRPGIQSFILATWPRTPDGALDLAQAPLRLQAIVNRFDLRNLANGDAGEGRFVFAFELNGFPLQATMIFEYKLPATSDSDVLGWATAFHGLGALSFGESYNAALQAITERFVGRGARPDHPNGNAINAVRTNEIDFGDNGIWEMREFRLSAASGLLQPAPLELTPDRSFGFSATLTSYINANQAAIIAEQHTVPAVFQGQPFQAGAVFNDLSGWFASGVDNEARHHFSLNTCNGCHSTQETGVQFLQISPRFFGGEAGLSGFLSGTTTFDPVTGQSRVFNDLRRRNGDLKAIVCSTPGALASSPATLRKGISRVH
jgi:hypothetical protein